MQTYNCVIAILQLKQAFLKRINLLMTRWIHRLFSFMLVFNIPLSKKILVKTKLEAINLSTKIKLKAFSVSNEQIDEVYKGIQVIFIIIDENVEKSLTCILTKFDLRLAVVKIIQAKINNFSLTSVLSFCQYCDRR